MRRSIGALRSEWSARWSNDGKISNLLFAAASVGAMTGAGVAVNRYAAGDAGHWYGSPFVVLVAVLAGRLGLRSGLLAAALACVALEALFFEGPLSLTARALVYPSLFAAAILVARPKPPSTTTVYDRGQNLPFTGRTGDDNGPSDPPGGLHSTGQRYWDVRPSGQWAEDCHVGAEYCRIWLNRMRNHEPYPIMPWILHDMIRTGRWSGIEAGFASFLERCVRTPSGDVRAEQPQQRLD